MLLVARWFLLTMKAQILAKMTSPNGWMHVSQGDPTRSECWLMHLDSSFDDTGIDQDEVIDDQFEYTDW